MAIPSVTLTAIHYSGTTLFADWQAVLGPGFEKFRWKIFDLDSPWDQQGDTTGTRIEVEVALAADTAYQMYVEMYADGQPVAMSQLEYVISERPAISRMVYAIGSLAVEWPALAQTGVAGYVVSIDSTSGRHENYDAGTNSLTIDDTFDPQSVWTTGVSGKTHSGISTGPQSPQRTIVLRAPVLIAVSYDFTGTFAAWAPLEQPGAGKFVATLSGGGSVRRCETDEETIAIPGTRDPQFAWTLSVAAESTDGVVIGPSSEQVTLILAAPSLDQLDYDAARLSPRWTPLAPGIATGYLIQLDDTGEIDNFPVGDIAETTIDIALDVNKTYHLWILATNGVVAGPMSNQLTPLTKPATHARLSTDLTAQPLTANWSAPNGGETGFLLELTINGVVRPDVQLPAPPFSVPGGLAATTSFFMRVRPTGTKVKGPWTPLVPGPYRVPFVYGYDRSARLHTLAWGNAFTQTWEYDDAGNILSATTTPVTPPQENHS